MLIALCIGSTASAQEIISISYSDNYITAESPHLKIPLLPKENRANKNSSSIRLFDSNLDENTLKSFEYAASAWEGNIPNGATMLIQVQVANIDADIMTTVQYSMVNEEYMPLALIAYNNNDSKRENTTHPDGTILINANTDWDYAIGDNISPDGKNLTYAIMRGIARIMGFGSSVEIDESDNYVFGCKRGYSVFDNLVVNSSGQKLTSISLNEGKPNDALKAYANAADQDFYVETPAFRYPMQSPPYSTEYPPFTFIADDNSLMRSDIQAGSYAFQVDDITTNILNHLGWDIMPASIKIISDDVPDTGLASAYEPHTFRIDAGAMSITNPSWTLQLPLADGSFSTISLPDTGLSCTVPKIENEEQYQINVDGDIEGRLYFSCISNGQEINAMPFKINFELKPVIEYATIEKIVDNSPYYSYDAHFKVKYRGADKILVTVEEEYGSKMRAQYIYEPVIAHGIADDITSLFYAWIDFTAKNKYGKTVYTIELQPGGIVSTNTSTHPSLVSDSAYSDNDRFEIYDINGHNIGVFKDLASISQLSHKGMLIVRLIRNRSVIKTFKIMR